MDLGWVVVVVVMYILRKVLSLDPLCFFVTADYEVEVKKSNGEPSKIPKKYNCYAPSDNVKQFLLMRCPFHEFQKLSLVDV